MKPLYLLIVLLAVSAHAFAQKKQMARDTAIKGSTIEIIQSYKPEVKQSTKPELSPNLPPADTTRPVFNYSVPPQNLSYTYSATPLRPLALGKDSTIASFPNYIKIGGGNLSTFYLDAGIGSLKAEKYETAIHLGHLSQAGNIKEQKTSLSGLEAEGTFHTGKNDWHAGLDVLRNQFHYYGYDHALYNYTVKGVQQVFTGIQLGVDMQNKQQLIEKLDYHPAISISSYSDYYKTTERTEAINLPATYSIDSSIKIHLGITGSFTQYNPATFFSQNNNLVQIKPAVSYTKNNLKLFAGITPSFGNVNNTVTNTRNNYILPEVNASYNMGEGQFIFTAGWQGGINKNTYRELSTRNPFIKSNYLQQQTRTSEVYGSVQTKLGDHLSIYGRVGWCQYLNMPLFINDTAFDGKQFMIAYDTKVTNVSLQAALRYQVANTFTAGLSLVKNNYNTTLFKHAWHEPGTYLKLDLALSPMKALTITGYISILGEIYAVNKNNITVTLNNVIDIGCYAEYNIVSRLSAFVQGTNLAGSRNERYMGYAAYGINVFGGIRFKF